MNFLFAPVQGHTDAPYRHFHAKTYGALTDYYTPFIRLERDTLRNRDVKDFSSPLNGICHLVPQIIFRDNKELQTLVALMKEKGVKEIDLNMGCPFPLQTGHGRGAATVANADLASIVSETVSSNPDIDFSVKIRLGLNDPEEWRVLLPYLNAVSVSHIAVHPRVAKQQYGGELYSDQFESILNESKNPVVFNGEIRKPTDIEEILNKFPKVAGIMIGRGLLGRPSLVAEYAEGKEWSREKRISVMLDFHRSLFKHYEETLCGDSQLIAKIKPFWEYAEEEIGRKAWKAIKKSTTVAKYHSAVAMIE